MANIEKSSLLEMVYPVGSIYMSVNATSPSALFGGTWVKIEGRFLLGSGGGYSLGATGGEAQHVLTVNEMPSHRHDYKLFTGGLGTGGYDAAQGKFAAARFNSDGAESNEKNDGKAFTAGSHSRENHLFATGGSQAHNNMPPYLVVNIWKRTA